MTSMEVQERTVTAAEHASGLHRHCDRTACRYWIHQTRERQIREAIALLNDLPSVYPLVAELIAPHIPQALAEAYGHPVTLEQLDDLAKAIDDSENNGGEDWRAQAEAYERTDSLLTDIAFGARR